MEAGRSVFDIFLDCAFSQDYNAMERRTEIEGKETQVRTQQSAALVPSLERRKNNRWIGSSVPFRFRFRFRFRFHCYERGNDGDATPSNRVKCIQQLLQLLYVTPYAPPESRAHSKELTNYVVSSPRHASPWMTDRPICVIDQCSEWCATQNN